MKTKVNKIVRKNPSTPKHGTKHGDAGDKGRAYPVNCDKKRTTRGNP